MDDIVAYETYEEEQWAGYPVVSDGYVNTEDWMGWLNILNEPYIYSESLKQWMYLEEEQVSESGAWTYLFNY